MHVITVLLTAVVSIIAMGGYISRSYYETASYRVVQSAGKFEVREYPAFVIAETSMREGDGQSFRRLFQFISGRNKPEEKISMTTPVFMSGDGASATMAFAMPAKFKMDDAPAPSDKQVQLREFDAGHYAVYQFSGGRNQENEAQALNQLRIWMQEQGIKEASLPIFGYFDPPWTLPFMRRNEVMLHTQQEGQ